MSASRIARRFASTTAKQLDHLPPKSIATAHLKAFPPPEARSDPFFDPHAWAALQPAPPSALSAFAHRIGLGAVLSEHPNRLLAACTHPSFLPLWSKHRPKTPLPESNGNLETLGNALLGMFAAEWLHARYPHLPTRVLKAAVSAYVGPMSCASVAKEMGAVPLLRWNRTVRWFLT